MFSFKTFCRSLVLIILVAQFASARPAQVVIVRHAEKPESGNEVNRQGCERAFSLTKFFTDNPVINEFGKPVAVYAQQPKSEDGSLRPIQTVAPTAESLGLKVFDPYKKEETDALASEILKNPSYNGKTVLIAWEHKAIIDVAESLGAKVPADSRDWPGEVFDQAWVLRFSNSKKNAPDLEIIPEYVLPGDNPNGGLKHWQDGPTEPGPLPILLKSIVDKCADNDELNDLLTNLVEPPLG